MLKPEGSGKRSYVSPCCMLSILYVFLQDRYFSFCSPMPDLVSGTTTSSCILKIHVEEAWEIYEECRQALGDALMR